MALCRWFATLDNALFFGNYKSRKFPEKEMPILYYTILEKTCCDNSAYIPLTITYACRKYSVRNYLTTTQQCTIGEKNIVQIIVSIILLLLLLAETNISVIFNRPNNKRLKLKYLWQNIMTWIGTRKIEYKSIIRENN